MPDWHGEIRARLQGLRLEPGREIELVEELQAHLDDLYQETLASGMTEEGARQAALAALDEPAVLRDALRPLHRARVSPPVVPGAPRRAGLLRDLGRDLRYGARGLRARPGFTAAAVVTLALGIGANTAIFSLVNAVLLQTVPVPESERVVHVMVEGVISYPEYIDLRDNQRVFSGVAAWGAISVALNEGGDAELVDGLIVTGNYFQVLGVQPALGRLLTPSDDETPGAHPVAVLDHAFWRSRFAGREDAIGQEVRLNGQRFTVVGVAPPGFKGSRLGGRQSLYVPMMMQAVMRPPRAGYAGEMDPDLLGRRNARWLTALGRLREGRSVEQARSSLAVLFASLTPDRPPDAGPIRVEVVPVNVGNPGVRARLRSVATLLLLVVGAVLMLACANVANLLLSRATERRREIAVRLALGASRRRLVRQLLTESVLLSCAGGLAGLLFAFLVLQVLSTAPPPPNALPLAAHVAIDPRVLGFTLALALVAGVGFGLAPALSTTRATLLPALKDESFVPDERSRRFNLRSALVVSQVSLSMLLLVAAGLFLRNLREIQAIDAGFDVERLLSTDLPVNLLRYTTDQGRVFYRQVVERVEALPGVESASVARVELLGGGGRTTSLHIEGRQGKPDRFQAEGASPVGRSLDAVNVNVVGSGFFRTIGASLRAGRDLGEGDAPGSPLVVVVNEAFWRLHYPDRPREALLGERLSIDGPEGPWREVVGVVSDSKYATLTEAPRPVAFVPLLQHHETGVVLYVRARVDPAVLVSAVRRAIQGLEPNLPLAELHTVAEAVSASTWAARIVVVLLAAFSALALLLAVIGVYGVTTFQVAQRTREIGIRMALGAAGYDVLRMVVGRGMRLVALGLVLGLALALAAGRSLESFLYGVSGHDPVTLVVVAVLLGGVALVACLMAARRAARLDPLDALRHP